MNLNVTVRGEPLERVDTYKYLGLIFDSKLSWKPHIDLIKSKIRPFLALLRRTSYLLPASVKLSVYYAHIHSHLVHLASVWGSTGSTRLSQLQRLQDRALKYIFWRERSETFDPYRAFNILKVAQLVQYEFCMAIYKIKNGLLKTSFTLENVGNAHTYGTRRLSHLQLPNSRTNYSRNSLMHEGVNVFNTLPREIRHTTSIISFKKKLKLHLTSIHHH